jgi:type VI secretion system secreted protein VgrG
MSKGRRWTTLGGRRHLVTEAEDKGLSQHGALYELVLRPPFARAACRTRSRIFLDKSLKEIIESVLAAGYRMQAGDPKPEGPDGLTDPFAPPEEKFAWRLL